MDTLLSPATGDYTGTRTRSLENPVYLRLMTPLGSYWADRTLGSRLHELTREKDVSRVQLLARQYTEQALRPLMDDGRARDLVVTAQQGEPGWLNLLISLTDALGQPQTFEHPVRVA
jgi:phage gp46-like protein